MKSLLTTNPRYRLFGTSIAALVISLGINRVQAHSKCDSLANATSAVAASPGAWPAAGFQVGYYTAKWIDETWFSSAVMPPGGLVNPPPFLTGTQYLAMCPLDTDLDFKPVWDGALTLVQKAHPVSVTIAQWKIARQAYEAALLAGDQTAALQALILANSLQRTGMEQFGAYKDYYRTYAKILHDAGKSFEAGHLEAIPGAFPAGINEAYVRSEMQKIVDNGAPSYEQQFFALVGIARTSISTTGVLAPALAYVNDPTPDPFLTAEVLTSPASLYYAVSAAFESEVRGALDSKLPPDFRPIMFAGLNHLPLGQAVLTSTTQGHVSVDNLGSSGHDGVEIRLPGVASCDFSWLPLNLHQPSPIGAWIQTDFSGTVNGMPDQSLGNARVTRVNTSALGYRMSADLTPLASPTVLVEVWNHDTLVASLPGTPGGDFGISSRWPIRGGKTGRGFGDWVLGCISWDFPDLTNFQIQGGGSYVGTRVLMLQESPPVANYLSGCRISASGVSGASATTNGFTITDATTAPLPSPSGFARIRFDCTYKLIPPTCTWTIVRSTTTTPDAFAGVMYHLQEAVQVPTDYSNLQLVVRGSNGSAVPFELSPDVAAKAQDLHPAPSGYMWVGFQSLEMFGGSSGASLLGVYSSRVAFGTANPATTAGASWFGSDAPVGSGHPSGEIYQAFAAGSPPDLDDDDIPDTWEIIYGLNPNLASDAVLDLDGDGTSNRLEYLAGTNPTDFSSVLKLEIVSASSESVHLQFDAAPGKTYVIEESSGLSTWETTQFLQSATVPHTADVVRSYPPARKFYRVRMSW